MYQNSNVLGKCQTFIFTKSHVKCNTELKRKARGVGTKPGERH